jgi:hydrogenase expression/formation protein HypE
MARRAKTVTSSGPHPATLSPYRRDGSPFRVAAVVFDFDGTLTRPGDLDFAAVRRAMGCPQGVGLLEFLGGIEDDEERRRKEAILVAWESEAADRCRANDGAVGLVSFLRERGVPMAIITRNRRETVERSLANVRGIEIADFAVVVARDVPVNPKPYPDGVLHTARELGMDVGGLLMIGDHAFDVEAGRRAGALTMFLRNDPLESPPENGADFVVATLEEAREVIRYGLPLPPGKLRADFLGESLAVVLHDDPAVLVGAGIGEDAAALDVGAAEVLVLASDPITLAADSLARYAVLANANDVATSGATPRWLLSTLVFPPGSSASEVLALTRDIQEMCVVCGVSLCGGHTEISDAVSRPLVVGTMAGTASATELVDKRWMREGDRILMTKGVAIEGTGLVAREFGPRLLEAGLTATEVAECAGFLERMGILEEARIARSFAGVSALHDVTEGGLATAVIELGAAGGRRLRVHMDKIPVYPQTRSVCAALGLDPFGLIGSGSLLITCAPADVGPLAAAIAAAGIEVADIGEVLDGGEAVEAFRGGAPVEWPCFPRDEVSRLYS